jgi:S-adenosylmethionine-diacylgycerolhomoserine-N-methlytransferase
VTALRRRDGPGRDRAERVQAQYARIGPLYDLLSGEVVYRAGRRAAVDLLRLRPGDRVVDLGCGTGLTLPLLAAAVGPRGRVLGVDASASMLARARRRARRLATPVDLVQADVTGLDVDALTDRLGGPADALVTTYVLSLVPDWERAWAGALALVRPGGRLAVVDMRLPDGRARIAAPLAWLACRLGGSDPHAEPWRALERDTTDVEARGLRGGHVQVRAGTKA